MPTEAEIVEVDGREIRVTNPSKVYFPEIGVTKLDLVRYYEDVADAALVGCRDRPEILHRFPDGVEGESFYQKRLPKGAPEWIETTTIHFPSGRSATEVVLADAAHLVWAATLGCLEINPWPVRRDDVDHPDELRVDLDPTPDAPFDDVRRVALVAANVLRDHGLEGFPKTSGKRGIHVNVRIEPRWEFTTVRRAALAFAREVERRIPDIATTAWWKEERVGVFLDYNQNARDRTVASAYSVRPTPDGRVSCPIAWDEVADVEPERFTIRTVPERLRSVGDPGAALDDHPGSIEPLLELAERDEAGGLSDAPWPPHFPKGDAEPPRVQPSKRRAGRDGAVPAPAPGKRAGPTGRRRTTVPLIEITRAATEPEALAGLERWRAKHPEASENVGEAEVLVDKMRGRSEVWYRIRVNLRNVPEAERPTQDALEVDYDPWEGMTQPGGDPPS